MFETISADQALSITLLVLYGLKMLPKVTKKIVENLFKFRLLFRYIEVQRATAQERETVFLYVIMVA